MKAWSLVRFLLGAGGGLPADAATLDEGADVVDATTLDEGADAVGLPADAATWEEGAAVDLRADFGGGLAVDATTFEEGADAVAFEVVGFAGRFFVA